MEVSMNKNFLLIPILAVAVFACGERDRDKTTTTTVAPNQVERNADRMRAVDDRNATLTPFDQSEKEADRVITKKIRMAIIDDGDLSFNGKNIKIITIDGVVTLRGQVDSSQEKDAIQQKAHHVEGVKRVDNQLEVRR
jgi:hyperosmotically inducible periplasmic protein